MIHPSKRFWESLHFTFPHGYSHFPASTMSIRLGKMRTYSCVGLLCLISICAGFTGRDRNSGAPHRFARNSDSTPNPLDCRLGQWSDWSHCLPCQKSKQRSRNLSQPAKYGGMICIGNLWESIICTSPDKCVPTNDCGSDFQCKESGRCIRKEMVCNGEQDCQDGSDEEDCNDLDQESSFCKELFEIPGVERAVRGFNILTQNEMQNVLDPKYFGGQCEYIYNGEWRDLRYDPTCEQMYYADDEKFFRKPFNFHMYQFLARADTGMSFEVYEDSKSVLDAIERGNSFGFGMSFEVRPAGSPAGLKLGGNFDRKTNFLKNISSHTEKNLQFVRITTKIQTARFRMRSNSLMLDEEMFQALMELPDTYNRGLYFKLINDFGTHFITSGTMGGTLDSVLVLDKEIMQKKELTEEFVSNCLGGFIGISLETEDKQLSGDLTLKGKYCGTFGKNVEEGKTSKSEIKDVITHIEGGDTGSAGTIVNIFNAVTYRSWGRSLKYNPAVIDFELLPIHEGLRLTGISGIEAKRQNLKRAYYEYLSEFNSCRCGPCENNGVPILDDNACKCLCPAGYEGQACEKFERRAAKANGMWSCWSSWSNCQSGKQQRTRTCNNPPPKNGGDSCPGKSIQQELC